jgi:hypothetical protein
MKRIVLPVSTLLLALTTARAAGPGPEGEHKPTGAVQRTIPSPGLAGAACRRAALRYIAEPEHGCSPRDFPRLDIPDDFPLPRRIPFLTLPPIECERATRDDPGHTWRGEDADDEGQESHDKGEQS